MSKKVTSAPKLSFDLDEEDGEDGDSFQVKKSKQSRQFKKMKQAPGILDAIPMDVEMPAAPLAAFGSSYSKENLAKLRTSQQYNVVEEDTKKDDGFKLGMELSGEAAEQLEELLEKNAARSTTNLGEYVSFDGKDIKDLTAIQNARLVNKQMLKADGTERVSMGQAAAAAPSRTLNIDMSEENDEEWEAEIIRRGVLNKDPANLLPKQPTVVKASSTGNVFGNAFQQASASGSSGRLASNGSLQHLSASVDSINVSSAKNSAAHLPGLAAVTSAAAGAAADLISIQDILKTVTLATDKLTSSCEAGQRREEAIRQEEKTNLANEKKYRAEIESGVKRLNAVQELRQVFASLVGMLREKQPAVDKLYTQIMKSREAQRARRHAYRTERQEDELFRLKEAGLLISIGNYTPVGPLLHLKRESEEVEGGGNSREMQVVEEMDEFGRVKVKQTEREKQIQLLQKREEARRRAEQRHTTTSSTSTSSSPSFEETYFTAFISGEGESSDNNNTTITADDATLRATFASLFEDVEQTELTHIPSLLQRLTQFRSLFPEEYENAFIEPSVTELMEILIKVDVMEITLLAFPSSSGLPGGASPPVPPQPLRSRPWYTAMKDFQKESRLYYEEKERREKREKEEKERAATGKKKGGGQHQPPAFVHGHESGGHGDDHVPSSAATPPSSMMSIAAAMHFGTEINPEEGGGSEEEEARDAKTSRMLQKVVENILFPWLQDLFSSVLDPLSRSHCKHLSALLNEVVEVVQHISANSATANKAVISLKKQFQWQLHPIVERLFSSSASGSGEGEGKGVVTGLRSVCVPQLKLRQAQPSAGEGVTSLLSSSSSAILSVAHAKYFLLQQLSFVVSLQSQLCFLRHSGAVSSEVAAKLAWQSHYGSGDNGVGSVARKLWKNETAGSEIQQRIANLYIKTVQNIAGNKQTSSSLLPFSSASSSASASGSATVSSGVNNLADYQLRAWGITIEEYRPLKSAVDAFFTWWSSSGPDNRENKEQVYFEPIPAEILSNFEL